jgi:hypothetical protein
MLRPRVAPDHDLAERRSLAYHSEIAARLAGDRALLPRARDRVDAWLREGGVARFYAESWRDILERLLPEIQIALREDSEEMRMLRQVSPFAGALPPRDRWHIWRTVGAPPP